MTVFHIAPGDLEFLKLIIGSCYILLGSLGAYYFGKAIWGTWRR